MEKGLVESSPSVHLPGLSMYDNLYFKKIGVITRRSEKYFNMLHNTEIKRSQPDIHVQVEAWLTATWGFIVIRVLNICLFTYRTDKIEFDIPRGKKPVGNVHVSLKICEKKTANTVMFFVFHQKGKGELKFIPFGLRKRPRPVDIWDGNLCCNP
jgi:hypothetical protein